MPKLTVDGVGTFEVPAGKRLVNALVDECGVDQLHACGGVARCTTCRVEFVAGEPTAMAKAERDVLAAKGLTGQNGLEWDRKGDEPAGRIRPHRLWETARRRHRVGVRQPRSPGLIPRLAPGAFMGEALSPEIKRCLSQFRRSRGWPAGRWRGLDVTR
jgi:ferredoxin